LRFEGAEPPALELSAARSLAEFERSYEKHRKKIVELVPPVHINANRTSS